MTLTIALCFGNHVIIDAFASNNKPWIGGFVIP